jgi:hypothetical protein
MACSKDLARRQREEQRAGVAGVVCGKEIAARGEHLQFVQMVLVGGGCGWPAAHHCGGWSWNVRVLRDASRACRRSRTVGLPLHHSKVPL